MPMTPEQAAQKWARNAAGAVQSYTEGIQRVTVNPMERAAARASAYRDGCNRAFEQGTFVAGCRRVSLDQWRAMALTKGARNYPEGIRLGAPRMQQFLQAWLPAVNGMVQQLNQANPRGDIEQNIQRMVSLVRSAAQWGAARRVGAGVNVPAFGGLGPIG